MKIENMFVRDINREIDGVIKVDFTDKISEELDEYVVTKEIVKHLDKFYNNYEKGVDGETTKIGVWVSGFFGSGKSNFIKILSYLLGNEEVVDKDGNIRKPIEYFEEKIEDPILLSNMKRLSEVETETILFNIDAKSPMNNKGKDNAILKVFIKVLNEHRGLCAEIPGVAHMERALIKEGVYDKFKDIFKEIRGFEWEKRREGFYLDKKYVAEAISEVLSIPIEDALEYLQNRVINYSIDIETFAKEVKEYIDSKGENFHLVFLADEIGQYIGNDGNLMLNLQTITEKLSTECRGRAWIIVTSQEKIDEVCTNIKGIDFSKIQGRFDTKLSMSSMSVDEVIKKRILEKKENTKMLLKSIYGEESITLKNIISFDGARKDLLSYEDEVDFVETYPFVPYQFKVLQSVFEQVRKHGNSGKHLSEGERSMLSAFKDSAVKYKNKEEGILIPFDIFYESIVEFLNPTITRVIERASNKNIALKDDNFNIRVLKLLFMLKYLNDEIPANLENIASLMVDNINVDKIALREKILKSLEKLKNENLIQQSGDVYVFLTDDEQDINKEIAEERIEEKAISKELSDYVFRQIYEQRKFRFITNNKLKYDKDYNKKMDEIVINNGKCEFGINVISPLSEDYFKADEALMMQSHSNKEVIIKLKGSEYKSELEEAMRIEKYIDRTNIGAQPTNKQKIIADKKDEIKFRRARCLEKLENAIKEAEFFICGDKKNVKGNTANEKIRNSLNDVCKYVYGNIEYIKKKAESLNDIVAILKTKEVDQSFEGVEPYSNEVAEREVEDFIKITEPVEQVRVKTLITRFTAQPFGWDALDVSAIVAKLMVDEKIRCKFSGEFLDIDDTRKTAEALTQSSSIDRVIINKKVKIDERLINKVKDISMEFFKETTDIRNEDDIAKYIKKNTNIKIDSINRYLKLYTRKYPGKSMFEKGKKLLDELLEQRENITLFNWIVDNELELLEWIDDVEEPIRFFENQREIFDKGLDIIAKCDNSKDYLDDDMKKTYENVLNILKDIRPYKDIKKIPTYVEEIEKRFEEKLKEKKAIALESINEDYDFLKLRAEQYGVATDTKEKIIEEFDNFVEEVKEQQDIYKVDAKVTQSSIKRKYFDEKIAQDIHKAEESDIKLKEKSNIRLVIESKGTTKVQFKPEKPKKEVEKVRISELVDISLLKTEKDVEVYISQLTTKLKDIIRSNKEVKIER